MPDKNVINEITVRTQLQPGDIGYIIYLHGVLYKQEYDFGVDFESYVAAGLHEFYTQYDATKDCVWICEHHGKIVGFLLLMHRPGNTAQLRYFIITPSYRGIGLGKLLMEHYMKFFYSAGYSSSYLWTTSDLDAAAALYKKFGFQLSEEKESTTFGRLVTEQRYDLREM
ncbi:MAG: GNAT family N-acetyltransferase [Chitinophagaceae bacterium]